MTSVLLETIRLGFPMSRLELCSLLDVSHRIEIMFHIHILPPYLSLCSCGLYAFVWRTSNSVVRETVAISDTQSLFTVVVIILVIVSPSSRHELQIAFSQL